MIIDAHVVWISVAVFIVLALGFILVYALRALNGTEPKSFLEGFWFIVRKYNLEGMVELNTLTTSYRSVNRLFRIVPDGASKEERVQPFSELFVEEMRRLAQVYYPNHQLIVEEGKTLQEIEEEKESWNRWCEMAWEGSGG